MNWKKLITLFALLDLSALSGVAIYHHGLRGVIEAATMNWWTLQFTLDLYIALTLVSVGLYRDARARGTNPWPFIALTYTLGSLGPLFYLAFRREEATVDHGVAHLAGARA